MLKQAVQGHLLGTRNIQLLNRCVSITGEQNCLGILVDEVA